MKAKNWIRIASSCLTLTALLAANTLLAQLPPGLLDNGHASVKAVVAVQDRVTPDLMKLEGILGTAVGVDGDQLALLIYVDKDAPGRDEIVRSLPPELRGVRVKVEQTEKFEAFGNTAKQTPPIKLGTSGGWYYDKANGYCCGGTLGGLLQVNGVQYVLSNYHVLEADIVSGGNSRIAATGNPVIQPGLIDVGCSASSAQTVGTLVKIQSLPGSNVDAAVARVTFGMVNTTGYILGIGVPGRTPVTASLSMGVKKSGRTTGLTTSTISGLNATISVTYQNECAGATAFTKTFTGQIVVANPNRSFLNSGDSGSLLLQNITTNPRPVGLLYAGSSTSAIANPIGQVLSYVGSRLGGTATMVGN